MDRPFWAAAAIRAVPVESLLPISSRLFDRRVRRCIGRGPRVARIRWRLTCSSPNLSSGYRSASQTQ